MHPLTVRTMLTYYNILQILQTWLQNFNYLTINVEFGVSIPVVLKALRIGTIILVGI